MAELNERVAVEVKGYLNEETQHLVMNKDQLFMNAYMAETQREMLERAIIEAGENYQFENAQIPVYCELSLYSDPNSEQKKDIPIFTEFNLATHTDEFRTLSYTEAIEAKKQFEYREKALKEQYNKQYSDYDDKKDTLDGSVDNQLEEYRKVFGTTEGSTAFLQDNRHRLEAINTQAQIAYGEKLKEGIMTYATKNATNNLVKLGYAIEKNIELNEKLYGIRPSDHNIKLYVKGIDAYGRKVDEAYELRDELIDKAARCGRSIGAVVENVVNYGEKTAEKINEAMYDNFVYNLTVAMSYSDKFKRIAERFLPQEEFEQACAKAENMRQFRKEVDSPLRDFFEKAAETTRTPFQVAIGIGYVVGQELGISEHLKKATSYAKAAYEATRDNINEKKEFIAEKVNAAVKKVDEAFIKAVDVAIAVPENVKKSFGKFLDKARTGGSEFVQTLKEFNEIGKSVLEKNSEYEPKTESKVLAHNLIDLHLLAGGNDEYAKISSSEKFKTQVEKAQLTAAAILDAEPAYALYSLDALYDKMSQINEQSFIETCGDSFNKVLLSVSKCGMNNAPKDIKDFSESKKSLDRQEIDKNNQDKTEASDKLAKTKSKPAAEINR